MIEHVEKLLKQLQIDYQKEEQTLFVSFLLQEFPFGVMIEINEAQSLMNFVTRLPILFKEEAISNAYIACNVVNKQLVEGCFYCDTHGEVWFNESFYYGNSKASINTLKYILSNINQCMEHVGKLIYQLSIDEITLEQYFDYIFV